MEKLTDLTVPDAAIHGRPGYHTSHGEITKRAPEASVFSSTIPRYAGWSWGHSDLIWSGLMFLTGGTATAVTVTMTSFMIVAPHRQG